ncbi:MAG: VOC family protein [Dehalococcoidia bacterium]|nr:VOC family protein [Dehalococcoidia bacterium]MSQ16513.1 VOC family protein [Dehalococcoidia bacterium]
MIEPAGISHMGICVRDIEKSLKFYRDILGMKVTRQETQDMQAHFGDRQAAVYQKRRKTRQSAHLHWGDGKPYLVLSSHTDAAVEGQAPKLDQVGIHHICFTVKDPTSLARHLVAHGVKLADTLEGYTNAQGKVRVFYCFDPDGILVQFDDGSATG